VVSVTTIRQRAFALADRVIVPEGRVVAGTPAAVTARPVALGREPGGGTSSAAGPPTAASRSTAAVISSSEPIAGDVSSPSIRAP
jgi:hypothetical protein